MSLTKFNPRVGAETIKTVDTIDDVKNSKDFSNPKLVLGGEILGDGDGGVYHWDSSSTRFADNVNVIRSAHKTMGRWLISSDTRLTGLIDIMGRIDTRVRALEEGPQGPPPPTYELSLIPDATSKEEGTSVTVRLTTTNGEYGTTLKYVVVGDIEEANEGTFDVLDINQDLVFTISNDSILESGETIDVTIYDGLGSITHASITINVIDDSSYSLFKDVTNAVQPAQTFSVRLDVVEVPDGDYGFTLTTTNGVAITPSTGVFTVAGGVGNSVEFSVPDVIIPAGATTTLALDGLNVSQTYDAIDSALTSPDSFKVNIDTSLFNSANTTRRLDIANASNVLINWGDGSPEERITTTQSNTTHLYPSGGDDYIVYIKQVGNTSCSFRFIGDGNECVTEVLRWGTMKLSIINYFMAGCTNLTTLPTIPVSFDTSAVTNMQSAWTNCTNLTSFPSGLDTSSVTNMSYAWFNCTNLTSFPSGLDTSSVINMSYAWQSCLNLLSFPSGLDTSKVTNMRGAWQSCRTLQSFPAIDTSSVTRMDLAWRQCSSITEFPSIDVSANTNFNRTWELCGNMLTFNPFINTTYTSAQWADTWKDSDSLAFTEFSGGSPFTNIGSNTIPVFDIAEASGNQGLHDALPSGSTYYPPFDVSGVSEIHIDDVGTTITDFNLIGWDQMTFDYVDSAADGNNPTVEIDINATLANTEVDNILNQLYSNLSNHTQIQGTSTYSINFHSNVRTTASDTAINGLIAAGWNIILNNVLQLGAAIQIGPSILDDDFGVDGFGFSVDMNDAGDRIIVGSPYDDDVFGTDTGQTKVYQYTDGVGWSRLGQIIYSNGGDRQGTDVTMNAAGNVIATGAWANDANGINAGRVQIYFLVDGDWVMTGSIEGEAAGDNSGGAISLNAAGDRIAIGAGSNDAGGNSGWHSVGHVRIFEYSNNTWTQLGSDIDGKNLQEKLGGLGVSMNDYGDRVAIVSRDIHATAVAGLVRIYEREQLGNNDWIQLGSDIDGELFSDQTTSVSMNAAGDRVAIGGPGHDGVGHTRIFEWSNNAWTQLGSNINGENSNDYSGHSVSMNDAGDRVVIGEYGARRPGGTTPFSGQVRIFQYVNNTWTQITQDIDGGARDYFGVSVSMNGVGDKITVGAIEQSTNGFPGGYGFVNVYQI
jgi:surface protein